MIVSNADDDHAKHIHDGLRARGKKVFYVDNRDFPQSIKLSYFPATDTGSLVPSGSKKPLSFSDIEAVYWRRFADIMIDAAVASEADICHYDTMAVLRSWMNHTGSTRWVNSWSAFQMHQEKPRQLAIVRALGVNIPRTYIGNDPEALRTFCKTDKSLIFKPVYGGAHTETLTSSHLSKRHLKQALQKSPVTIQDFIAGTNIRTYVIGDKVFSAEIASSAVDFRADINPTLHPLTLPKDIQEKSLAIKAALALSWTAIDWRRDKKGDYYFLEANPSPMFIQFEKLSGLPLTSALLDHLIGATQ